jgi:membrane protein DedA with SNARE-associated domain
VAVTHDLETYGLILLFALVAVESCGIPLPGETALIAAGVLAGSGRWNIVEVIAVAAVAAFIGDNAGYWIARIGGRPVIAKIPIARDALPKLLPRGEAFFERHGPKTVVIGRFVAGLRVTVAWLAGLSHMDWKKFAFYNALGGILWATAIGLGAYYFGRTVIDAITEYGLYAAIAIAVLAAIAFFGHRSWSRRRARQEAANEPISEVESNLAE